MNIMEKINRPTVYLTTSFRSSVVAMIRGVNCALATCIATSKEPKVKTTNESVAVTKACSTVCAPAALKLRKRHPSQGSNPCTNRLKASANGMATKGTTQSDDLR